MTCHWAALPLDLRLGRKDTIGHAVLCLTDCVHLSLQMGKRQGLVSGTSLGGMQFVMFCSYAVALFYGAHRIAMGAYTGGDVVNVIIAALLGSFSLGLVSRGRRPCKHMEGP